MPLAIDSIQVDGDIDVGGNLTKGGNTITLPSTTDTIALIAASQSLTNKTLTGSTNTIEASALRTSGAAVDVSAASPPSTGQVLTATSATTATWQTPSEAVTSISTNTTLDSTHSVVLVATGSGSVTVTLPTAVGITGKRYTVKKNAENNIVVLNTTSSQTIDGATSRVLIALYEKIEVCSNGSNWIITIGRNEQNVWDMYQSTDWTEGVTQSSLQFTLSNNGTASTQLLIASESGIPGIMRLSAGTTATARSAAVFPSTSAYFGDGVRVFDAWVRFPTLSDGTVTYTAMSGWGDTATATTGQTNGVFFIYQQATSVNWRCFTSNGGVQTATSSTTAVASAAWQHLRIIVNNTATSVAFYVADMTTPVVTTTTNIPVGLTAGAQFVILKSAGTGGGSNRSYDIDTFIGRAKLTTER